MKLLVPALFVTLAFAGCASEPLPNLGIAPDYTTTLLDGSPVSLEEYEGNVLILNLWATWCAPCKRELPMIESLLDEFEADGLRVLAVSMDDEQETVETYVEENQLGLEFAFDERGREFLSQFKPHGSLKTPPETFLIDREGNIVQFWGGAFDPREPDNLDLVKRALAA